MHRGILDQWNAGRLEVRWEELAEAWASLQLLEAYLRSERALANR
jgi:hypothetical protein